MRVSKRSFRQKNPVRLIPHWRKGSYGGVCEGGAVSHRAVVEPLFQHPVESFGRKVHPGPLERHWDTMAKSHGLAARLFH